MCFESKPLRAELCCAVEVGFASHPGIPERSTSGLGSRHSDHHAKVRFNTTIKRQIAL